ncbi:MAG: hypothetical protein WD738_23845 [Pirellulales bacterium]
MPTIVAGMTGPFAERLFRIAFALAGCYNLAFGLWAAIWPLAFFELFALPPPRYPGIWACLGMVVGVYGLLYWHAAWKLETAWPIIAVGFLGKVLGPIGMAMYFGDGWPRRLGMICIFNDLIWWLPFGLFLVRGTALGKRLVVLAPWLCVTAHVVAFATLPLFLRPGMLTEPDASARGAYIAENAAAWTIGWSAWMLAAISLVGFYAWWGGQLAARPIATVAVLVAAFGTVFDFSGEGLSILLLVERATSYDAAAFTSAERAFTLLSAGAANGLYTLGGLLLTLATPNLPTAVRAGMWITWIAGIAMTVAGVMNHVGGMVVSTIVLFPLLIAWTAWMGARWRRT